MLTGADTYITILIYAHAALGSLALLVGLVPMVSKKGSAPHRKAGTVFFYAMLASASIAIVISVLPGHKNSALLAIGVFTVYLVLGGYRSARHRRPDASFVLDKLIARGMLLTGAAMILLPVLISGSINIVLGIFGLVGIGFAVRDLVLFRRQQNFIASRLQVHIGKMTGAYIASVTAFIVVNELIPGLAGWLLPSILGTIFVVYWIRRVDADLIR